MELKLNQNVNHVKFGKGTVVKILPRENNGDIVYITFDKDGSTRKFTPDSIEPFLVKESTK